MSTLSLGDLAQSFLLQRRSAALKTEMSKLTQELTTGEVSDVKSVLAGNVSYLTDIENDLQTLQGFRVATTEAAQFAEATQIALGRIQDIGGALSSAALSGSTSALAPVLDGVAQSAESDLSVIMSALNTSNGGRMLFAGDATDRTAAADATTIMTALRAATAGIQSPEDLIAATDAWFDDPAGFTATAYLGSDTTLSPFRLSDNDTVTVTITAADPEFRALIRNVALAALAADPGFAFSSHAKQEILSEAGNGLFTNQEALTALRAKVGAAQARIETVTTQNAAEQTSLTFARNALLQADPYETATKLEEVQFQLQSLYTVTARMSDLSLVNFIR